MKDKAAERALAQELVGEIRRLAAQTDKHLRFMEVCGTHTVAIFRAGIRQLLPENVELVSGPGCPVCVTPDDYMDKAITYAQRDDVIITTFGDMLKVPGSQSSLLEAKTAGADIRIVYSPLDSLQVARENPDKKGQSPESPNSTLSELITAGAESLHAVSEELPLTRLCDEILTQLGVSADNKLVFKEIKGWLMNENYLTEAAENGKTRLATTILSDEAGIVEREKISSLNRSYKTVLFPKEAQEFIFENLGEIFGNS